MATRGGFTEELFSDELHFVKQWLKKDNLLKTKNGWIQQIKAFAKDP